MCNEFLRQPGLMRWLLAVMWLSAGVAYADERLQLHGYLSQTAVHTSDNNFGGKSSSGVAWDIRELGANFSYRPDADWLISGQALARWAGEMDDGEPRIDYAFIERSVLSAEDSRLKLMVGKIKNPYGLYNATRDVSHTRPGVLMPQAVYLDRMRNFFLAAPGASIRGEHEADRYSVNWQLSGMRMEADDPELKYLFVPLPANPAETPGKLDGSASWLGQVMVDLDGGKWRGGLSFGDVGMKYEPRLGSPYPAGKVHLQPITLSLQHNAEHLTLTTELSRTRVINQISARTFFTDGWYVQATWRFLPRWQGWLRQESLYFDKDLKDGSAYSQIFLEPLLGNSQAWVMGVRYDPTPQWSISAEAHRVSGAAMLSPQDNFGPIGSRFTRDWDMFLLQATYRF